MPKKRFGDVIHWDCISIERETLGAIMPGDPILSVEGLRLETEGSVATITIDADIMTNFGKFRQ